MPLLLLKYWRVGVAAVLFAALAAGILSYGHSRYKAGAAATKAEWAKDTAARELATAEAIAAVKAKEAVTVANNAEVLRDYNEELIAIAADRDSLFGRVRDYQDRLRRVTAGQATDQLGVDVAGRIARSSQELAEAYDRYDKSCQRDAAKLTALQDEIRPQL